MVSKMSPNKKMLTNSKMKYPFKPLYLQKGFTLIEFMVAAILGLIVLLAIGGAYVATQKVNEVANSRVNRQQELRLANNMLIRDARMAGSFGCANLSGLADGAGSSDDHGATQLAVDNASYFNINNSAGANRIYSARIVSSTNSAFTNLAKDAGGVSTFTAKNNSDVVIFNYGVNTQPLLTMALAGTNDLSEFTLSDVNGFSQTAANTNARVVLSSCNRLDIIHRNQLTVTAATKKIRLANSVTGIPMNKTGVVGTGGVTGAMHYAVQATLSNLQTVAYAVGQITGDAGSTGLYRFELLNDGSWSSPQLLARNVSNLNARFIYVTNCAVAASAAGNEVYKLSKSAFLTEGTVVVPPTGVELTLTPSATTLDANVEADAADNVSTNATDLTPIVLNATMRGANVCANR